MDTVCSSSLVSAHLACRALATGDCNRALSAGVNLLLVPTTTAMCQAAGMLALDGRCKALDAAADGYGRSEAAGALFLTPWPPYFPSDGRPSDEDGQVLEDHAAPLVLLASSAVNQDGRSSSLTAPSGPMQQVCFHARRVRHITVCNAMIVRATAATLAHGAQSSHVALNIRSIHCVLQVVIRAALSDANADPHDVAALQLHGTGTGLGDPIEVSSAAAVLRKHLVVGSTDDHMPGASPLPDGLATHTTCRTADLAMLHSVSVVASFLLPICRSRSSIVQFRCLPSEMPVTALAVLLMASKSWNGHAEPAAGLVAMLHAHQSILHAAALPLLHLRHLNPYVSATMETTSDGPLPWARAGRQPGGSGGKLLSCGISAFAFQVPLTVAGSSRRSWTPHVTSHGGADFSQP